MPLGTKEEPAVPARTLNVDVVDFRTVPGPKVMVVDVHVTDAAGKLVRAHNGLVISAEEWPTVAPLVFKVAAEKELLKFLVNRGDLPGVVVP